MLSSVLRPTTRPILWQRIAHMATTPPSSPPGPLEQRMHEKLTAILRPTSMMISNDSWKHRHHAPMRAIGGGDGETHFSVQVVSDEFRGKNTMQRHRMIYAALSEELEQGLHALSLKTKTVEEAEKVHV